MTMTAVETPAFEPHPLLKGGHAQTIAGRYLVNGNQHLPAIPHVIDLKDGDRLCCLESIPDGWASSDPAALLIHGLAGCARSPYVVRFARRLVAMGVRVVRMNLRGAGDGFGLAKGIYHAGRTDDVRAVMNWFGRQVKSSPIALVGFSLGANLALKLSAEAADAPVQGLDCVLAANPPIDLAACSAAMSRPENRVYDWNFVHWLRRQVARLHRTFPDLGPHRIGKIRSVYEFDDQYTAPRNGFASAIDYYNRSSALTVIPRIIHPGLVVHAADDPFIPAEPFHRAGFPATLEFELTRHGGHLGYISRGRWNSERRWLDTRLAGWLASRWGFPIINLDHAAHQRGSANIGVNHCHA